jgi:hypothetical protein
MKSRMMDYDRTHIVVKEKTSASFFGFQKARWIFNFGFVAFISNRHLSGVSVKKACKRFSETHVLVTFG